MTIKIASALYDRRDREKDVTHLGRDRLTFFAWAIGILSILAQASLLLVSWGKLPPAVPLFYSRPWGEQILAAPVFLSMMPAVALFSLILNFLLASFVARDDIFLRRVLIVPVILVAIITLYNTIKIVSLLT